MFGKKYRTQLQCKIEKKTLPVQTWQQSFLCIRTMLSTGQFRTGQGKWLHRNSKVFFYMQKNPHYCFFHKLPKWFLLFSMIKRKFDSYITRAGDARGIPGGWNVGMPHSSRPVVTFVSWVKTCSVVLRESFYKIRKTHIINIPNVPSISFCQSGDVNY